MQELFSRLQYMGKGVNISSLPHPCGAIDKEILLAVCNPGASGDAALGRQAEPGFRRADEVHRLLDEACAAGMLSAAAASRLRAAGGLQGEGSDNPIASYSTRCALNKLVP